MILVLDLRRVRRLRAMLERRDMHTGCPMQQQAHSPMPQPVLTREAHGAVITVAHRQVIGLQCIAR